MRILIIDDNPDTHDFLETFLKSEGFQIYSAYTGTVGLHMVQQIDPDLVLLDVRLPQLDGWETCRRIRVFSGVPIVLMSAVAREEEHIIRGLDMGADDYFTKPIQLNMLKARVQALLRRTTQIEWRNVRYAYVDSHLVIDLHRQQIVVQGELTTLTSLEYRLLSLLVRNMGQTVPTLEVVQDLWSDAVDDDYVRYVRIYIKRLREILEPVPGEPQYIINQRGLGYSFRPQV